MCDKNDKVMGMEIKDLMKIKLKMDVVGLDLNDLITYMDRNEVQLFAELRGRIKILERQLSDVRIAAAKLAETAT